MAVPAEFKSLFWDTGLEQLDVHQNRSMIVERILNYGDEDAYRWMFKTYTDDDIIYVLKSNRRIIKKAAVMMANFYRIPREALACTKNASVLG